MPAPELPDWCLEEEEGHSDKEEQNGGALEAGSRPSRKRPKWDPRLKVCVMLMLAAGVGHCPWLEEMLVLEIFGLIKLFNMNLQILTNGFFLTEV